jgi:hypothetical protein
VLNKTKLRKIILAMHRGRPADPRDCDAWDRAVEYAEQLLADDSHDEPPTVRDVKICNLPYQPEPFVHGWISTAEGPKDVWLRNDGKWTTEEGDVRNSLMSVPGSHDEAGRLLHTLADQPGTLTICARADGDQRYRVTRQSDGTTREVVAYQLLECLRTLSTQETTTCLPQQARPSSN